MQNPFADLSPDERKRVLAEIGIESAKKFEESRSKLLEILEKHDAINLLSVMAAYGLTVTVGDGGVNQEKTQLQQAHVEICQALALSIPAEKLQKQLADPQVVQEAWDAVTTLLDCLHYREIAPKDEKPDDELAIELIQQRMRGNTQLVRNWGFLTQVKTISRELYSPFDDAVADKFGFTISTAFELFEHLMQSVEDANTVRFQILAKLHGIKSKTALVDRYHEIIGADADQIAAFKDEFDLNKISRKQLFFMMMSHLDLRMHTQYEFVPNTVAESMGIEVDVCRAMFEEFSHDFGALAESNPEHLYLSNPIWTRPIIRADEDCFYCVLPQLFFSFIIPTLERLIASVDKVGLSDRRAEYLEAKITEIIGRRFPESNTETNFKWKDGDTEYETDVITFIDSHIIIFEAKSGKISDPALRGAPDRIRKHLDEILIAPNIQSKRLQEKLDALIRDPDSDVGLRDSLPVAIANIHKVLRVSVSLEDFGSIQANISLLEPTGWLPDDFSPCPTMTLADFETLFDFLEHPVQIVHYLERRQELEGTVNFVGDELDLMGWYAGTLFDLGDIDAEKDVVISGMSSPLDVYYNSKDAGVDVAKPKPMISGLFQRIFEQLESRRTPRWTEIGVILNRFSPDIQLELEINLARIRKNVRKEWDKDGHENMLILNPSKSSEHALAFVLFCDANVDRKDEFRDYAAQSALEPEHVKQALIIGKNIDDDELAYHFIALVN